MSHFKRLLSTWKKTTKPNEEKSLTFISKWVDSLHNEMKRHRGDSEFQADLLDAAAVYFNDTFTDREKVDVFIYTLGKLGRK